MELYPAEALKSLVAVGANIDETDFAQSYVAAMHWTFSRVCVFGFHGGF